LPPGYKADDLDDLPPEGKRIAENRYFAHIQKEGQWKHGIQGYLASIHYADAMLGKVLTALDASPHAKNTIVVLWSDHGWHLGEKNHWQKYTGWRACTRVPLIIRVPPAAPGLPAGTQPARCNKPVNLVSLFPTLLELCGLPAIPEHDGPSLVPLLRDPQAKWDHLSTTFLGQPGSYSLSGERWRFIHYANGEEELYDIETDPYEWKNLAADPAHAEQLKKMRDLAPAKFAPKPPPSFESLIALKWHPLEKEARAPASKPDGSTFEVTFLNQREHGVKLWWMDPEQKPRYYAEIEAGKRQPQKTRPGAVWLITDAEDQALGYFEIGDRAAKAIVPKGP
jgi:arylsulfatase A-like enzyme